jgi:hypothetical protein
MFVAESFLIGSAKEGKASLIEKTPEAMDFYESSENYIISTNHFQGDTLGNTPLNVEHVKTSATKYRFDRVHELLGRQQKNSVANSIDILRNQLGLGDKNIGLGNERTINQLVAHHSIVFQPEQRLVWVSTGPWQLGKFVCYDLNKVFNYKPKRTTRSMNGTTRSRLTPFFSSPLSRTMSNSTGTGSRSIRRQDFSLTAS